MSIRFSSLLFVWFGASLGSLTGYLIGVGELKTAITQIIAPAAVILAAYITEKTSK